MNIFILDEDPKKIAEYHCDKHIVKMILESAQMLSTTHWIKLLESKNKSQTDFKRMREVKEWLKLNTEDSLHPPYAYTHPKHPCTVWTCSTLENYKWHVNLLYYMSKEYTNRYKRIHKTSHYIKWFLQNKPIGLLSSILEEFPICMDNKYKISNDPIECYRNYYIEGKSHFAKWRYTKTPDWYLKGIENK